MERCSITNKAFNGEEMKYRKGCLYYVPGGRYINGKDKAGMNEVIGYGSLSKIEPDEDPKKTIFHFNQILLFPDRKIWHYKKIVGQDCVDSVNTVQVTQEEEDYHNSKQDEFATRKLEFELPRGIYVDDKTGEMIRFTPGPEEVKGKRATLISKIYNLIIEEIEEDDTEELKKKNTELTNENISLTKENTRLSQENADLQDKLHLVKEALKL
jgi:hypothetical protein